MAPKNQKPDQGRIVRYVDLQGKTWPAIIALVEGTETVTLNFFADYQTTPVKGVKLDASKQPDTWHWPEF
jgi:hypothetical protein